MASAAQTYQPPGQGVNAAPSSAQQRVRPFCQAAKRGIQPTFNISRQVSAAAQQIGPTALTASGGFIRRVTLETIATGGSGAATVSSSDFPWRIFSLVRFAEPNNTPILELSGFNLVLADYYGGYAPGVSPGNDIDYVNNYDAVNPQLWPYIPVELDPTGMGALSDLSSASGYQLTLLLNPSTSIWNSPPASTLPTLQINAYTEYWTLPNDRDMNQNPQATVPPYAGTVQLWSQIPNVSLPAGGGNARVQLNRMGNQLRTVIMVTRAAGARSSAPVPNPFNLRWDDVLLMNCSPQMLRKIANELTIGNWDVDNLNESEFSINVPSVETGVTVIPFSFGISRFVGGNGVSSLLPTVTDTRFELSGSFGAATTPTLDWIINDVSAAPVSGLGRTQVPGGVAYYPPAPPPVANTM